MMIRRSKMRSVSAKGATAFVQSRLSSLFRIALAQAEERRERDHQAAAAEQLEQADARADAGA